MNHLNRGIIISLLLLAPQQISFAEYLRATNEDEIILISTESEIKMGKALAKGVEKQFQVDEDAVLQERVDSIGQEIARICDRRDIPYHFKVITSDKLKPEEKINAFALPGGYIYIFREMVELLESDNEIAAILAHEVGHVAAKHSILRLQGSIGALVFQFLAVGLSTDNRTAARANNAIGHLMMSYSREDETTADRLAVKYLKAAGYDPKAVLITINKMIENHRKSPIRRFTAYRTHPYLSERRAAAKQAIYGRIEFVDFINRPIVPGDKEG